MPKFHSLKVKDIRRETDECVSVAFAVPEELKDEYGFIQGQHLTLRAEVEGEEVRRSYSICASPEEEELRVAVKQVAGGRFSTFVNRDLQVGDSLDVMTPMGRFFTDLDPTQARSYVAFAAGSGITPVISILKTVLLREPKSVFTLFYGNRRVDSIIFREELEQLKNRFLGRLSLFHILSREMQESPLFSGHIDAEKCETYFSKLVDVADTDAFFLCGPEAMIHSIREVLLDHGVDRNRIHFELFTTPGSQAAVRQQRQRPVESTFETEVVVTLDGTTFSFPMPPEANSILDAAMETGADLPYACKGGVCCTCRARLIEGEVEMAVNYALEEDEVEAGYILTCQALPTTEKVVVNFDD